MVIPLWRDRVISSRTLLVAWNIFPPAVCDFSCRSQFFCPVLPACSRRKAAIRGSLHPLYTLPLTLLRPRSIWTIFYQPITKSAEIQKYFYPSYQFQVHPALGLGNYCVNYQCFPQPDVGTSLPDKGEVHSTALKNAFQPLKKIGRAQFQPLEHIFDPSKRSVEHMSIKPPQNLVEHNPNRSKRLFGHIFNPWKRSMEHMSLSNPSQKLVDWWWGGGRMSERVNPLQQSEHYSGQILLHFTFCMSLFRGPFEKYPCKTFMLYK